MNGHPIPRGKRADTITLWISRDGECGTGWVSDDTVWVWPQVTSVSLVHTYMRTVRQRKAVGTYSGTSLLIMDTLGS